MMRTRDRWIALACALFGFAFCGGQLLGFVGAIRDNGLAWNQGSQTVRDHYLAVGQSYSQGFATGFFLCLSMMLIAFAAGVRVPTLYRASLHSAGSSASANRSMTPSSSNIR